MKSSGSGLPLSHVSMGYYGLGIMKLEVIKAILMVGS